MPRKLDPVEAERRELKRTVADCESVLADPGSTLATRARMIELRLACWDRLRVLAAGKPKPDRSVSSSGQDAGRKQAETGQDTEESVLHPECAADQFYRLASDAQIEILLNGPSPQSEDFLARYGREAVEDFVTAYDAAIKAEQQGEPWNPPPLPEPVHDEESSDATTLDNTETPAPVAPESAGGAPRAANGTGGSPVAAPSSGMPETHPQNGQFENPEWHGPLNLKECTGPPLSLRPYSSPMPSRVIPRAVVDFDEAQRRAEQDDAEERLRRAQEEQEKHRLPGDLDL